MTPSLEKIEAIITELGIDQDIAEATSKKFTREAAAALVIVRTFEQTGKFTYVDEEAWDEKGNNVFPIVVGGWTYDGAKERAKFCREQAKLYAAHAVKISEQIGEMACLPYVPAQIGHTKRG